MTIIRMIKKSTFRYGSAMLILAAMLLAASDSWSQTSPVKVLGWWKSDSEAKAANLLFARLTQESIQWQEVTIPAGAPGTDLKSRVLNGTAPDLFELKGPLLAGWSSLGGLTEFKPDKIIGKKVNGAPDNNNGKWDRMFFPQVTDLVRPGGHLVAVPLGIHRMNTLFYNRIVLQQYGLPVPTNWDQFTTVANRLAREGVSPLAQSGEPWQIAALFEALLLSESSPELYRRAFVARDPTAFSDMRFTRAMLRLKILKKFMAKPIREQSWVEVTRSVIKGDAAMMIMGDFAKGELNARGYTTDVNFGCVAVPQTGRYHIYDIDTLVIPKNEARPMQQDEKIAQLFVSPNVQADYNVVKGSVPVLKNADQIKMDSCARNSWQIFSRGSASLVPSLARDMATDRVFKNAVTLELVRYFMDDSMSIVEAQHRFYQLAKAMQHVRPV